jgi:hypothetical protein
MGGFVVAVAALVLKLLFFAGLLAGAWWIAAALRTHRKEKRRAHRKARADRRRRDVPVGRDRRVGPRRTVDVADSFLKELEAGPPMPHRPRSVDRRRMRPRDGRAPSAAGPRTRRSRASRSW